MTKPAVSLAPDESRIRGHEWAKPSRVFVVTLLATLLVQAAWILAVPTFLGRDEYQHAFRAADVARGDWSTHHAELGRGELVTAPRDLVDASSRVCSDFPLSDYYNCHALTNRGSGLVSVISTAAWYNPLYYWPPGTVAIPFHGASALYAMRVASAVMCALLIAVAGAVVSEWARTLAPIVGFVLALTPSLLYATSMVGPNGLEMTAGLALWAALLSALHSGGNTSRLTVFSATLAGCLLGTVRGLGPLWLLMIVATWAILVPRETWVRLREKRRHWMAGALMTVATLAGLAWNAAAVPRLQSHTAYSGSSWAAAFHHLPVWVIDAFAVFPLGNGYAPAVVYMLGVLLWGVFGMSAAVLTSLRMRLALVTMVSLAILFPLLGTVATYHEIGNAWQGRYELPFTCGFALLLGYALNDRSNDWNSWPALGATFGSSLVISIFSTWHIVENYRPIAHAFFPGWHVPSWWALTLPLSFGFLAPAVGLAICRPNRAGHAQSLSDRPPNMTCVGASRPPG